ncbi:MAG: hypothetical protein E6H68_17835 [Betaproteobacteria bacterium]|nr:MAG: hypothetical protein E6H68_17835 [Betaproteobacteria bacterium]
MPQSQKRGCNAAEQSRSRRDYGKVGAARITGRRAGDRRDYRQGGRSRRAALEGVRARCRALRAGGGGRRPLVDTVTILGTGAASALLAVFVPAYARFFLRSTRRDAEVCRYAEALFLRHELFKTRERNGILILVSCFERKVEILADVGLHRRVSDAEWRPVIARMTPLLRERRFAEALQEGLAAAEELLAAKALNARVDAGPENELPDRPIDEAGES